MDLAFTFELLSNGSLFSAVAVGVAIGLACGLVPGLTGITTLVLLIPFTFGMEPLPGMALLVAAHAVVYTGGSVTAILFGIPGAPANSATIADGHALALTGHGGRAVGAAVTASCMGGLVGFAVLVAALPFIRTLLPHIGSPEIFLFAVLAIVYAANIGEGPLINGLIAGALGLLLGTVGYQPTSGVPRFWMGLNELLDGIGLVPLVTGLFAGPALLDMARGQGAGAGGEMPLTTARHVLSGAGDALRRPWLVAKAALIGSGVGVVPGVGGDTAPFVAYAWLMGRRPQPAAGAAAGTEVRDTADAERRIEGVVVPEASNNAKEGGALIPTLGLGVPGSAGMTVLLGSFALFGLEPSPLFLLDHADLAIGLAFALATANVLGGMAMLVAAAPLARLITLPAHILVPVVLTFATLGVLSIRGSVFDLGVAAVFAAVGALMQRYGFSRPALVLGFVLAPLVETYFRISMGAFGAAFLLRPLSMVLAALIAWRLALALYRWPRENRAGGMP